MRALRALLRRWHAERDALSATHDDEPTQAGMPHGADRADGRTGPLSRSPEFELARVAAQFDLLGDAGAACPHCDARWVPLAGWPDAPTVVRTAELKHEDGCPACRE